MIDGWRLRSPGYDAMSQWVPRPSEIHDRGRTRGDGIVVFLDTGDGVSRRAILRDQTLPGSVRVDDHGGDVTDAGVTGRRRGPDRQQSSPPPPLEWRGGRRGHLRSPALATTRARAGTWRWPGATRRARRRRARGRRRRITASRSSRSRQSQSSPHTSSPDFAIRGPPRLRGAERAGLRPAARARPAPWRQFRSARYRFRRNRTGARSLRVRARACRRLNVHRAARAPRRECPAPRRGEDLDAVATPPRHCSRRIGRSSNSPRARVLRQVGGELGDDKRGPAGALVRESERAGQRQRGAARFRHLAGLDDRNTRPSGSSPPDDRDACAFARRGVDGEFVRQAPGARQPEARGRCRSCSRPSSRARRSAMPGPSSSKVRRSPRRAPSSMPSSRNASRRRRSCSVLRASSLAAVTIFV